MMQISNISAKKDINLDESTSSPSQSVINKFAKALSNPIEEIVQPLLESTFKSVKASDPTRELQEKINQHQENGTLAVPAGDYGAINIEKNLTLNARDPTHPPHIQRINAINISQLHFNNLSVGNQGLTPDQVRALPDSETGIRVVLQNDDTNRNEKFNISIKNTKISGVADAINISSLHPSGQTFNQSITISDNTISDIQRDGIILKNVGQYGITNNHIHSLHPNYEPFPYEQLKKSSNAPNAAVILPNGILAQHADGIQVTNAKGGSIQNNELKIGNGTWYQAINVHHELDSNYRRVDPKANQDSKPVPVSITNNKIENNHDFAINIQHYDKIYTDPNIINSIALKPQRSKKENMDIREQQLGLTK